MELQAVRIFVKDMNAAIQFYEEKLGLIIKANDSEFGYCVFSAGNTDLVVETVSNDAPEEDQVLVGRFTGVSFTVKDAETKYHELAELGVPFSGKPEKQF